MKLSLIFIFLFLSSISYAETVSVKKEIHSDQAPAPIGIYSQAIRAGNTIYISGQIPVDPTTGKLSKGDFASQVERTLLNIRAIALASGGNLDNIVKMTVYLQDLHNFETVNTVLKRYFHQPFPARVVIEVKSLPKQAPIEIEAIMRI